MFYAQDIYFIVKSQFAKQQRAATETEAVCLVRRSAFELSPNTDTPSQKRESHELVVSHHTKKCMIRTTKVLVHDRSEAVTGGLSLWTVA